jgi:hypothetical protein
MRFFRATGVLACLAFLSAVVAGAQQISVETLAKSRVKSATATVTKYEGSAAVKLNPKNATDAGYVPGGPLLLVDDVRLKDGVIDVDVAGAPAKGAPEDARGFIGVVFRAQSDARFEIIYLRPTNSHADDQLRRNHTTQYSSEPEWPWDRLRKESPGVYESWVDMEAGRWTHMRVEFHGTDARLYVNHAANPCLVVHGLKLGNVEGGVGLWMGQDTEGYFKDLKITKR